ncbi:MAG: competence/damage-inducible protein A [Phycisphaerae bacterium]
MNAWIISIGDELVSGQTVDTNAAWLSRRLAEQGIPCDRHITVGDDRAAICEAIVAASEQAKIVLITGGLGPTPDDLTREALADAMGEPLRLHTPSLNRIEAWFKERRRRMHPDNQRQAMFPESAQPIDNAHGTAPGIIARLNPDPNIRGASASRRSSDVYCLPGVPHEMRMMFQHCVLPRLAGSSQRGVIAHRVLHTMGRSEAAVGEALADLMQRGRNPTIGTSVDELIISVRIQAQAATPDEAGHLLDADAREIVKRLGETVFGAGDDTLADAVARLLIERGETLSTAESCTGGLIAKRLTDVPGSSNYMVQGFVTYANESKRDLLGVPEAMIANHGAVSREVAEAMATGCRRRSGTDYALATTGIAGPTGGTPKKPIGFVFITLAQAGETIVKALRLGGSLSRHQIRDRTAKIALNMLRCQLINRE